MFLDNIPVHNLDESDFFVAERIENCAPLNFRKVTASTSPSIRYNPTRFS